MSLAQIGEFSFILAALGTSLGQAGSFLYPVAVAVSAVTTLSTPYAIRASGRAAAFIDCRLPPSVQTAVSFYGSWVERLLSMPDRRTLGARVRRIVRALALDAAVVSGLAIGAALAMEPASRWLESAFGFRTGWAKAAVLVAAALLALPFSVGLFANGRRLGISIASAALPEGKVGAPDLAAAPRRALLAILELGTALLVLLPIAALTQPFLPGPLSAALLAVIVFSLGVAFWRSAANLQGHVRAGAQVIVEALARQGAPAGGPKADLLGGSGPCSRAAGSRLRCRSPRRAPPSVARSRGSRSAAGPGRPCSPSGGRTVR